MEELSKFKEEIMRAELPKTLTQSGLVAELKKRGHTGVTTRRLTDWRQKDLLPPFDSIGAGKGQGRGRKSSTWSEPERVIDHAVWVLKLLEMYRSSEEIYVPLVTLGYPVPNYRVYRALSDPLNNSVNSIDSENHAECSIEDVIGDAAYAYSNELEQEGEQLLSPPRDILEAAMNLFLNPGYELNDAPFEDAVVLLENWNKQQHAKKIEQLSKLMGESEIRNAGSTPDTIDNFLTYAPFIQECLTLHRLKQAVDEATEDDLDAMLLDVGILRELLLLIVRMITILAQEVPDYLKANESEMLPALFSVGQFVMCADLSLRRNGYADIINQSLPKALEHLRSEFDAKLEHELSAASPVFGRAMTAAATVFESDLEQLVKPRNAT